MNNQKNHISQQITNVFNVIPEPFQRKIANQNYINQVYKQFEEVVDGKLLKHVNSVYLLTDKQALTPKETEKEDAKHLPKKLIIYVDTSICAAEFNARRELIVLKYRELFGITISLFEIRISKGSYKESYPFIDDEEDKKIQEYKLTKEDYELIEEMISTIEQPKLRDSFRKALIAQKKKNGTIYKILKNKLETPYNRSHTLTDT